VSAISCDKVFDLDRAETPDAPPDAEVDAATRFDRDKDDVFDDVDLCLTGVGEGVGTDIDQDTVLDVDDTCPLDSPNGADTDGDGLGTNCDPFDNLIRKDRARCLMLFSDLALNSYLWAPRAPDTAWSSEPGKLIANPSVATPALATAVVAESIEGNGYTSYDAVLQIDPRNKFGSFTMYLRADPTGPSPDDLGCRFVIESLTSGTFGVVQGSTFLSQVSTMTLPQELTFVRIQGRIVTAGGLGNPAAVSCHMDTDMLTATRTATTSLPPGRFGLMVDRWLVELHALSIIDQL